MIIKDKQELGTWCDEILDYGIAKYIGHFALVVYLALRHHAHSKNPPPLTLSRLMRECHLDKKTIVKSIRLLKQHRLLEVIHQKAQDNIYIVRSIPDAIRFNQWPKISDIEQMQQPSLQKKTITDNSPSYTEQPLTPPPPIPVKVEPLILTDDCPYCNERGLLRLVDARTGHFNYVPCNHNLDRIKTLILSKRGQIIIESAKPGYQEPIKRDLGPHY